jgi:O-succinylbenzoic acid--CoA ligase
VTIDGSGRDLLAHRRRATPGATAIVRARDGRTWTYGELDEAVETLADRLAGLGVTAGDRLGACLGTRPAAAQLVHAAARMGVTLVPLSDRWTARELAERADRAGVTAVVCGGDTEAQVRAAVGADAAGPADEPPSPGPTAAGGPLPIASVDDPDAAGTVALRPGGDRDGDDRTEPTAGDGTDDGDPDRRPRADTPDEDSASDPNPPPDSASDPEGDGSDGGKEGRADDAGDGAEPHEWGADDALLLMSTSGTTGAPKLVRVTPRMVLASAVASAVRLGVTPGDRWYDPLSVHHTGGVMPLYRATLYGTAVILRDGFNPATALSDLAAHDATGVSVVPTMLRRLVDAADGPDGPDAVPASVRTVLLGGAPARRDLIATCRERSIPVHPTYGMTETASQVATARPATAFETPETVGHPLLWTVVTVVDGAGEPVPEGTAGEIVVDGPTVTPGYEVPADREGPESDPNDAFGPLGLHTGDVGRIEDGRLFVVNRLDDRILTGGENVDPGEVVAVLREHPAVRDAAVVGVPDEEWGERVGAALVPADGGDAADVDLEAVASFCRERLAGFKLPRRWAVLAALPRTASGTVDRGAVREAVAGADESDAEPLGNERVGGGEPGTDDATGGEDGDPSEGR